jgi:predicted nuclease of predicted toxin-antitoxin system
MRFLADMGISPKTVAFLRSLGHEALHLHEQGLDRLPDPAILEKARTERWILLTHDLDFGDLMAASGDKLPSIVVFRLRNMHPEHVSRHLKAIIAEYHNALDQGVAISVTEGQVRVRLLPLHDEAGESDNSA